MTRSIRLQLATILNGAVRRPANVTIPSGIKLGRYEIRSQIGAGGMGEVYLAQDTKLDRKVALKILPADLAATRTAGAVLSRKRKPRAHWAIQTFLRSMTSRSLF